MATPTLTRHIVPGVLGDIDVDVRAGGRDTPRAAVVTVHGFKGFKDWGMWPPFAERLARAGVTAVSLNLSGSGVDNSGSFAFPERFGHNTFSAELEDLGRVIAALYRGDLGVAIPSSLGLVGHSRGGGMSILHTVRDSRVRALATWSAISTVERWRQPERDRWRRTGVQEVRNARTGEVLPLYTDVLDDIEKMPPISTSRRPRRGSRCHGCSCTGQRTRRSASRRQTGWQKSPAGPEPKCSSSKAPGTRSGRCIRGTGAIRPSTGSSTPHSRSLRKSSGHEERPGSVRSHRARLRRYRRDSRDRPCHGGGSRGARRIPGTALPTPEGGAEVAESITQSGGHPPEVVLCDLASQASIHSAATEVTRNTRDSMC